MSKRTEVCPCCGAPVTPPRISLREMAAIVVCGALLLSILILAFPFAECYLEEGCHRFGDRLHWYRPLEDWNP
jgi:hypothetical protein